MNTSKKLEGHQAMQHWDKTCKMGHIPRWVTKSMKHSIESSGTSLWDHIGTVRRGDQIALFTQPYNDSSAPVLAKAWADEHGCNLVDSHKGGPWHEATWYFEFLPKN